MSAAALRSLRAAVAEIAALRDPMSCAAAASATAALDKLEADLRSKQRDWRLGLLLGVDLNCIYYCDLLPGGAVDVRARHASERCGMVEVSIIHIGDEATQTDSKIVADGRKAAVDSLIVEIVRENIGKATDFDLLSALDAAERGEDPEVGTIKAEAHDRGLRLLS